MFPITLLYASLLAILFFALTVNTIRLRRQHKIGSGDGNIPELTKAIRAHAHFAEFVPYLLLLMALYEASAGSSYILHLAGIALLIGRLAHAWSLLYEKETYKGRVLGMMIGVFLPLTVLIITGLTKAITSL